MNRCTNTTAPPFDRARGRAIADYRLKLDPSITLRPVGGMPMHCQARS